LRVPKTSEPDQRRTTSTDSARRIGSSATAAANSSGSRSRINLQVQKPTLRVGSIEVNSLDPTAFRFGIIALLGGIVLVLFIPEPSEFQQKVFAALVGLAGACISSSLTGFLEISSRWIKAGGAIAVFVFLCFFIGQAYDRHNVVSLPIERLPSLSNIEKTR
jgi:hypothetical protein